MKEVIFEVGLKRIRSAGVTYRDAASDAGLDVDRYTFYNEEGEELDINSEVQKELEIVEVLKKDLEGN